MLENTFQWLYSSMHRNISIPLSVVARSVLFGLTPDDAIHCIVCQSTLRFGNFGSVRGSRRLSHDNIDVLSCPDASSSGWMDAKLCMPFSIADNIRSLT